MSKKANTNKKICPKDYKGHHYWHKIGCDNGRIIYQCFQCRKCAYEKIEIIGTLEEV